MAVPRDGHPPQTQTRAYHLPPVRGPEIFPHLSAYLSHDHNARRRSWKASAQAAGHERQGAALCEETAPTRRGDEQWSSQTSF